MPVTVQSPDYTFAVNFRGQALQPYANNLDYAAEALPFGYGNAQPAVSPSWVVPAISASYHFGFDVGIAGIFHGAGSSLMANWQWYHSPEDSATFTVDSTNNMIGPFFEIGPDASVYKIATGTVRFHFDEVNLDYGTFVRFGDLLQTNLFAGVGFARLVQHRVATFTDLAGAVVRTLTVPASFIGAGPQVGFDFDYKVYKEFRFVGNSRATLFVGTFKNQTTFSTFSNALALLGDINPNIQTTQTYSKGGIVPGFEGRLGFAYETAFDCNRYLLKIEAGYQAQIYINSLRSTDLGSEVTLAAAGSVGSQTVGVYARTFQRTVSDFSLAGPYANLEFAF